MALCDLLLRLAEEPAFYRPVWSDEILTEMARALQTKLRRTPQEAAWRRGKMEEAFPEAMAQIPSELVLALECIPDKNDRHVLAAAIMARAETIVTQNIRHFPKDCLEKYGVVCQTADHFLLHQYQLAPQLILDKLDDQAAGISAQIQYDRAFVVNSLRQAAPGFSQRIEADSL